MATPLSLLVVGGNGFVGSSIVKAAVARGWNVTSLSRSGSPYKSPQGHSPAWTRKVDWRAGSPFDPSTYTSLLPACGAVVSTLGILLENDYKQQGKANPLGVLQGIAENVLGGRGNPLSAARLERSYERMNRDAALAMYRAFAQSSPELSVSATDSPFVYISAEDIFRPFIPARYIQTKRETERIIADEVTLARISDEAAGKREIRPVFIRPSLIYHPHVNPTTTLPATLLEASANIHSLMPSSLRLSNIFPAQPSAAAPLPPAITSLASLLTVPPIHVDAVGEAVCRSIESPEVEGVVDVARMRGMLGFETMPAGSV